MTRVQDRTSMSETKTVVVERDIAHPPEKLWRADAAAFDGGVADEERLQAGDRSPLQFARRVGRRARLRGARRRAAKGTVLHLEFPARRCRLQPGKRGDVHADADSD